MIINDNNIILIFLVKIAEFHEEINIDEVWAAIAKHIT